jgi:cob(I)alamin adenosyltransferase
MNIKIYTKTGDTGETSLLGGRRVGKNCIEMHVIGEVDELNANLGAVIALLSLHQLSAIPTTKEESLSQLSFPQERESRQLHTGSPIKLEMTKVINFLQHIQRDLFKFGAELASLQSQNLAEKINKIDNGRVEEMEVYIDQFWSQLPELKNFILPGGSLAGAEIHRARTVCRRAERQLVDFSKKTAIRPELNIYLNRLSDFLFALARWVNAKEGVEEIIV